MGSLLNLEDKEGEACIVREDQIKYKSIVVSICVSNEVLYLVNIVQSDDVIKKGVKIVEQIHNLKRRAFRGDGRETNNIREINTDFVKNLRMNLFSNFQLICYGSVKEKKDVLQIRVLNLNLD